MRPKQDEYDPFYETYVSRVGDDDVMQLLALQPAQVSQWLEGLTPEQAAHRYAADKWSLEEVLGHVLDIEWVVTNRVLRFARGDSSPLPGVDQHVFMRQVDFGGQLPAMIEQFVHLRAANLILFNSLDEAALERRGEASGCTFTVRALLYFIAGHAEHHLAVIRELYL